MLDQIMLIQWRETRTDRSPFFIYLYLSCSLIYSTAPGIKLPSSSPSLANTRLNFGGEKGKGEREIDGKIERDRERAGSRWWWWWRRGHETGKSVHVSVLAQGVFDFFFMRYSCAKFSRELICDRERKWIIRRHSIWQYEAHTADI